MLYELLIAARTDEKLRATLQDVLKEYSTTHAAVRALPGAERVPEKTLGVVVMTLINAFDGAAIKRAVLPQPELDAEQITLLLLLQKKLTALDGPRHRCECACSGISAVCRPQTRTLATSSRRPSFQ